MKNIQDKSWSGLLMSLIIALTMFAACTQDGDLTGLNYDEVADLGTFYGDPQKPKVLINLQDGPFTSTLENELLDIITPVNTDNIIVVNFHQWQVKEPRMINQDAEPNSGDYEVWTNNTVDRLAETIRYFKDQSKEVYVFGIGYGSLVAQELLVRYGNDMADAYMLSGSRLKMDPAQVDQLRLGFNGFHDFSATPSQFIANTTNTPTEGRLNKLYGQLANRDYLRLLENEDLSNVTYIFGERDEAVGALSQAELSFLTSQNANTLAVNNGNHDTVIRSNIAANMEMAFGFN